MRGVPWIFVAPTAEALEWLDAEGGGLTPYETLPPPESGWDTGEYGQVRTIVKSAIHRVETVDGLKPLLERYGEVDRSASPIR